MPTLLTLHNKLLRILQNKPRNTRVPQMLAIIMLPTELRKHQLIVFVYNYLTVGIHCLVYFSLVIIYLQVTIFMRTVLE